MALINQTIGNMTPADLQRFVINTILSDPAAHPKKKPEVPSVEPWQMVSSSQFQNSWVNYLGGYDEAAYYKDPLGRVHLKGLVKSGTAGTTIFTLPDGYRPSSTVMFPAVSHDGVNYQIGRVDISNAGSVFHVTGGTAFLSLSVSFRAA